MPRSFISLRISAAVSGARHRRLHADADQSFGVVERLPRVAGDARPWNVRVAAPAVARVELGAAIDEQLHDVVPALERRAHQRRAPIGVRGVRVETEIEQHANGLEVLLG